MYFHLPRRFQYLYLPARYKVAGGGRGSAKSWSFGAALISIMRGRKLRVLCTREYQATIKESVHYLLRRQIEAKRLDSEFVVTDTSIRRPETKGEFIFKGLRHDPNGVKSLEDIDVVWIEEAQSISDESLVILDPTIRNNNSELWFSYNPDDDNDPVHKNYVLNPPPGTIHQHFTYRDNPYFRGTPLETMRQHAQSIAETTGDWDAYNWIWEGLTRKVSEALVFRKRVKVHDFETPSEGVHFYHGADWGFSNDPTVLIRCYKTEEPDGDHLWVDQEVFGVGVELDELPQLFHAIPTAQNWLTKADNARPETISYMRNRHNFNIEAAQKWNGSVEDGVAHLKSFVVIHVHPRCINAVEEFKLYSYKLDKNSGRPLPIIVDAHNHSMDALRYALDDFITKTDDLSVWTKLGDG